MNELQQTVNARELHAFLQSKQDFSTWIKNRIEKYGFVENQDFAVFHKKMENLQGGRSAIEYYITLDVVFNHSGIVGFHFFVEANKVFISHKKMENPKALVSVNFTKRSVTNERINQRNQIRH